MKKTPRSATKFALSILLLFLAKTVFSQSLNHNAFQFGGLPILTNKKKIVEKWDKPKIARPEYECGMFSEDTQGKPYYQLLFSDFNYVGNEKEGYALERVKFNQTSNLSVTYEGKMLNYKTSVADFQSIFKTGRVPEPSSNGQSIYLEFTNGDHGIIFYFRNGFLVEWEHWSPC